MTDQQPSPDPASPPPAYPVPPYAPPGYSAPGYGAPGPVPSSAPPYTAPGYPASNYAAPGTPAPGKPAPGTPAPGYQPPGYPEPGYGMPGAPGYPYAMLPPSGRKYWGLLFLFYIPYVGVLVAIIVSLIQRSEAKNSPILIVRENARWAANWALSYTTYFAALMVLIMIIGVGTSYGGRSPSGFIGIPAILLFVNGIYCLVTVIRGTVISNQVVHRPLLAIPFFR